MKKQVLLVLAMPFKTGGFLTYALHWYLCLIKQGHEVTVIKPCGGRDESFYRNRGMLQYRNLTSETTLQFAKHIISKGGEVFVPAVWQEYKDGINEWQKVTERLAAIGAGVAYQHPSDVTPWLGTLPSLITIGTRLADLGGGTYVKQPYHQFDYPEYKPNFKGVCPTRIHNHKRSEMVIEAALLMGGGLVLMGSCDNRWERVRWINEFGDWKKYWYQVRKGKLTKTARGKSVGHGGYSESEAMWILKQGECLVDLTDYSTLPGQDGGRSQYLFLEAWHAKRPLIIHKNWLIDEDPTMKDGVNCKAISTVEELVGSITDKDWHDCAVECGVEELLEHHYSRVVPHLLNVLEAQRA